ncbi:unnamed protein product [Vicia faba]|uniref:Uncharacterized protein n=1 Tax=Vicia faba TaxID=3906 RepID=A0AAV1AKJ7_VICFA|nr:unnamed protein product [Vicia faba]
MGLKDCDSIFFENFFLTETSARQTFFIKLLPFHRLHGQTDLLISDFCLKLVHNPSHSSHLNSGGELNLSVYHHASIFSVSINLTRVSLWLRFPLKLLRFRLRLQLRRAYSNLTSDSSLSQISTSPHCLILIACFSFGMMEVCT